MDADASLDRLLSRSVEALEPARLPTREWLERSPPVPDETPYARTLLQEDERGELLVMSWQSDVRCVPHGHDGARGAIVVLRGRIEERIFETHGGSLGAVSSMRRAAAGACMQLDEGTVHDMVSIGDSPAVTLHVYRPRIETMRLFDLEEERTLVVDGGAGAWWPVEPGDVRREMSWSES
jgi:predicted metal-dependent enzyme (double-stranded beta helix superfamily)